MLGFQRRLQKATKIFWGCLFFAGLSHSMLWKLIDFLIDNLYICPDKRKRERERGYLFCHVFNIKVNNYPNRWGTREKLVWTSLLLVTAVQHLMHDIELMMGNFYRLGARRRWSQWQMWQHSLTWTHLQRCAHARTHIYHFNVIKFATINGSNYGV